MNEPESHADAELDALFAHARAQRFDTSAAEYAFETRLMARLRTERSASSVWAMISWRMAPIFAACVLALTVWHAEVASEAHDTEQVAALDSPDAVDLWNNLN